MALPSKGTRTIEHEGKTYRWRLGKTRDQFATLAVEAPNGRIWTKKVRTQRDSYGDSDSIGVSVTPADVKSFIDDKLLTEVL